MSIGSQRRIRGCRGHFREISQVQMLLVLLFGLLLTHYPILIPDAHPEGRQAVTGPSSSSLGTS